MKARQRPFGQQLERPREKQQNEQCDQACGELRELAAPARTFDHLGFGRTSVDDEGPRKSCTEIGERQAHDVGVLVELLVFLRGESSRGRGALGQNDDAYGSGCGQELLDQRPAPMNLREAEPGEPARYRAQQCHPEFLEMEKEGGENRTRDGDECSRDLLRYCIRSHDGGKHCGSDANGWQVRLARMGNDI